MKVCSLPIDTALGLHRLNRHYDQYHRNPGQVGESFFADALRVLRVRYTVNEEELSRIPRQGPIFIVANHPFGGIDGLILCDLLQKIRPDFKILANYILSEIQEFKPYLIPVDPFEGKNAAARNALPIRQCLKWLKEGHCIMTFPAGEVSHLTFKNLKIEDPVWNSIPARLIRRTGAAAVPIYFAGGNSKIFNILGLLHPRFRTLLLAREMHSKANSDITMRIGKAIHARRCSEFENEEDLTRFLRLRTYLLSHADEDPPKERRARWFPLPLRRRGNKLLAEQFLEPIGEASPREEILAAVKALPPESLLYEKNDFQVFHAIGKDIPVLLREIGRLREITFRGVHEGTGKAIDIDDFDDWYIQLFLWDKQTEEIVGAYRMGQTDVILPRRRRQGFYTNTLFKYRTAFLEDINPALEMGRSFIRPEYQRKGATLALLWMAIGSYLGRNPRYRLLFGPVSINCDYSPASRDLIIRFLSDPNLASQLAPRVKGKMPPPKRRQGLSAVERSSFDARAHDADDISAMISEIERDGKGMPTLLRHYLKLNGRFICFNIDPDFGDVLDGLIIVDMIKGDPRIFQKYFGKAAIRRIFEYYGVDTSALDPEEVPSVLQPTT